MYIVYKITHKINNKVYIGQTSKTLSERIKGHIYNKSNIGKALVEEGIDKIDIQVLDVSDSKEKIDMSEQFWIKFYNSISNGYNVLKGGNPDKEEMKKINLMKKGENKGHTRKWLRKKQLERENEFVEKRHQKFLKFMEKSSKNEEKERSYPKKNNKFINQELEIARKLGIDKYIQNN